MSSSATQKESRRYRFRKQLHQLWRKPRDPSNDADIDLTPRTQVDLTIEISQDSSSQNGTSGASTPSAQTQADQSTVLTLVHKSSLEQNFLANDSTLDVNVGVVMVSSDIWSTAYREAVESLGKDIDVAILKGENVAQLFRQLEEIDKEADQESLFLRGVKYLKSLQVPLEKFKLVLDVAAPLANIEPTATIVFGVVRSVTAIAISFASADLEFAKQIGEMLEQISYIDDCDTLGQKVNKIDIHKALVLVYRNLLEFYSVAFKILTKKGAKLVLKMILQNNQLPSIVQEFLRHADNLHKLVQKATLEIVGDIKAMLYDQEIARWLGSGKMSQQNKHHADLQNLRADKACEFLLSDAKFINWYCAPGSQQLVILGNMGYGKSVAMAFVIDELRRRNKHQLPQPKICYHYCRDDETGQTIYIFSALILSLLEQLSGLKKTFFDWYKQAWASGNSEPATNFKKLEEFLQKTLETLDRPLFIVIDGLDECDSASQNSLLQSLKILSQKTPRLKVILSSRPEEEILEQLDEMPKIDLGSDAKRDRAIVEKTVEMKLPHLSKDLKVLIIETLSRLAQGSAIWTKMTVEFIKIRKIRALGQMQKFLKEETLPVELTALYVHLFSRYTSNDPENILFATTALEVLAVTRRPLTILELAWAVALGAAQQDVTNVAALAKLVDHQRVMSLIQPFVDHVDFSDVRKRQVKLVHQSVKEFIVEKWPSNQPSHQRTKSLEAGILDICIRYLLLDDFNHTHLFTDEQVAIEELPQEVDLFSNDEPNDYDPYCTWESWEENMIRYEPTDRGFGEFFVYASCHWLEHLGGITAVPLPDLESLENLCQAGSTRLRNWIKQNCRPDCTIQPRFVFDSTLYDPLSIISLYGSEAVLRDMLENSDFDNDKFLPNPAMVAADQIFQWGELSRLRILFLGSSVGYQLRNLEFFRLAIKEWSTSGTHCQDWDVVFDLVEDVLDILVQEQWGNELLCVAAGTGCMPIIRRLMDQAQHNAELRAEIMRGSPREPQTMSFGKPEHQSIGEAVLGNHIDVVEYLLGQQGIEAHLQHRNTHGENVLHLASRLCNPAMFQLLAPRFRDGMHQTDDQEETALVRIIKRSAASGDRYGSAQILLLEGAANGDSRSGDEQPDPLRISARIGDLNMCVLLISVGKVNPLLALRRDDTGQMVLKEETSENEQNMIPILQLLRAHADAGSILDPGHHPEQIVT